MPLHWEQVFDAIAEGLLALGRNGMIEYANAAGAATFGCTSAAELRGRQISEFLRDPATAGLADLITLALEEERPAEAELFLSDRGRWMAVRSYPAPGGVTVLLQDVTDRRLAEDSLRVSRAKFAGIVNISADAIISIDADHRIIHFNSGAEEIFGWPAADMIGQPLDALIPERFRASHPRHIRNFAASSVEARRMGERREIAALRRNGEEFPAEASISKLSVGDQRVFTVVLRDVTDRKRREATYRRLYEEAQRAVAARDDVLSFVSHDLGNPLAAIRIATAVLLKRVDPHGDEGRHIVGIREAVEQAQRLIRDLLDVQKAETGKLTLHLEQVDIHQIIDDAIHALQPLIDDRSIRVTCNVTAALRADCDPDRMTQVLTNLVGNAVKFSPAGSAVVISAAGEAGDVIIAVRDEGPGIAADELPHIFDRFFQARQAVKVGHGLGLSIVQALTKAHGGRVWVESRLGEGSTFFVGLPVVPPTATPG
ncbi:MAG: PAS domain-containing sensor histidine kinase [Gemmatimonadota bacterium]